MTDKSTGGQSGGLGLEGLGDLSSLLNDAPVIADAPLHLELNLIDEDPNQPRQADNPGFSNESLEELAATIKERGVKSPISVRMNPDAPGRYLINHGARRYRASVLAGKENIPAFIDNDYNEVDQVIENLQRDELTAREIADFIGRELAKGKKKGQIAKELGKSPAFVTQHVTLLDLPVPIAVAFTSGRTKDVTVVNELVTAHKRNPDEVATWLADETQDLTRGSVKLLREYLDDKRLNQNPERDPNTIDAFSGKTDGEGGGEREGDDSGKDKNKKKEPPLPDPEKLKKAIIFVTYDERMARLLTTRRPTADGWAWLKYEDDGHEFEADLGAVRLMSVIEG